MTLLDIERDYLARQPLGRLATLAPDGAPQVRPVGFTYNAHRGTIDIRGMNLAGSRKFRNIAVDPRVAFVVDDLASTDPWTPRGVEVRGHAEALEATDDHDALIRVHPRRVLTWGLDSDPFAAPRTRDIPRSTS